MRKRRGVKENTKDLRFFLIPNRILSLPLFHAFSLLTSLSFTCSLSSTPFSLGFSLHPWVLLDKTRTLLSVDTRGSLSSRWEGKIWNLGLHASFSRSVSPSEFLFLGEIETLEKGIVPFAHIPSISFTSLRPSRLDLGVQFDQSSISENDIWHRRGASTPCVR